MLQRRRRGAVLLPAIVAAVLLLSGAMVLGMAQASHGSLPMQGAQAQNTQQQQPLGSLLCFGLAAGGWRLKGAAPAASSSASFRGGGCPLLLSMAESRGGKKGRGGKGGKKTFRPRVPEEDEDEEITTYVSCPKCMSDSFIKAEVLGESKRLRCNNCGKSFNATSGDLNDINDVYQKASSSPPPPSGEGGGFTEDSFFEMFGDKKSLQPPP